MNILSHSRYGRALATAAGLVVGLLFHGAIAQAQDVSPVKPPDVWRSKNLTGQSGPVFSLYGCPGNLDAVKRLIARMEETGLGNGFDPGPAAVAANADLYRYFANINWPVVGYPPYGGEFQVKHGRSQLTDADEVALQVMDDNGVFVAIQLGEWGYYFHNLSTNEQWHRDVFGDEFETFKAYIKPAGLQGYDARPTSRKECYDQMRDYFLTRHRAMRGRTISVTGHSHYEAYAGEWGSKVIGLELGENIAFTQSKIAFARGAARRWARPFSIQVSPWFAGSCTTSGPLRMEGSYARGLDAGHSLSFYRRLWLHSWFAGAALITPENSISIFFQEGDPNWTLSEHGHAAAEVFKTIKNHDPGVPYTPVAIVLDHYAGYNAYQGRPWGVLDNTPGDLETRDLFQQQLFPGSDHVHAPADPANPEEGYLCPTPYGEMFDVILSSAGPDTLASYPVLLLIGDHQFDAQFVANLSGALRAGSRLLVPERHAKALGEEFDRLKDTGAVEVLEAWTNPATGRPAAVSNARLARLRDSLLPVRLEGDAVQYQINHTASGWIVEIVHNRGVTKTPTQPAVVDESQIARVVLTPRVSVSGASLLRSGQSLPLTPSVSLEVPAGETRFVKFDAAPCVQE